MDKVEGKKKNNITKSSTKCYNCGMITCVYHLVKFCRACCSVCMKEQESDIDGHAQPRVSPASQPPASEPPAPQPPASPETDVIEQLFVVDDSSNRTHEEIIEEDYDAKYPVTEGLLFDGGALPPPPDMERIVQKHEEDEEMRNEIKRLSDEAGKTAEKLRALQQKHDEQVRLRRANDQLYASQLQILPDKKELDLQLAVWPQAPASTSNAIAFNADPPRGLKRKITVPATPDRLMKPAHTKDPLLFEHVDHIQIDKNMDVILRDLRK